MKFFLIYDDFFYKNFGLILISEKINIWERGLLYISYIFAYLLLSAAKTSVRKVNQTTRR